MSFYAKQGARIIKKSPYIKRSFLRPRSLIIVFLAMAAIMVSSALIELHQSKRELLDLMKNQGNSLLESVITSSSNTLLTNEYLENFLEERLLNNANFIRYLYEKQQVNDEFLKKFANENNIFRINIYTKNGRREYSNHSRGPGRFHTQSAPLQVLSPIFQGQKDTLVIGFKEAQHQSGYRFAVALAARNRSAIVLNLNAEKILQFRRRIGFGTLLQQLSENPGIVFLALQDTSGIIAASGNVSELERIVHDPFLKNSLMTNVFSSRTSVFNGESILEVVHPFNYNEIDVGLFRLGISLKPLNNIRDRIIRRLLIITFILVAIGFLFFTFMLTRQHYHVLQKQYQVVESYSGAIIQNVSDAIIVFDEISGIKIFNLSAEKIFQKKEKAVIGKKITALFDHSDCSSMLESTKPLSYYECAIRNKKKYLLVSKSKFEDEHGQINTILLIRDFTERRKLEDQLQRKERLTAMGELASGVAHEIRNPLNTIATIIQQLKKDFQPQKNSDEYHQLSQLVYGEVQRINETISDFLKFSRPHPIQAEEFLLSDLFDAIKIQYDAMFSQNNIHFSVNTDWNGHVFWDRPQMQQLLMNLIQNSVDAIKNDGIISIFVNQINEQEIKIQVSDNGPGISESQKTKIFNLYYTTKAKGTGIGLSIVQRIILEHGGLITVESEQGKGANFILQMPIRIG